MSRMKQQSLLCSLQGLQSTFLQGRVSLCAASSKLQGLQGLKEKGLQSRSANASLLIKKLSVHEGRNKAFFTWPRKADTFNVNKLLKSAEGNKEA